MNTKLNYELREYQTEAVNFIVNEYIHKNTIISLPTGTGKNMIIIFSMLKIMENKINAKFLCVVPRIILMEQLYTEIIKIKPSLRKKILLLGDGNIKYKRDCQIIIAVYNSFNNINNDDLKIFDKIYVDEAHHIRFPSIYLNDIQPILSYDNSEGDNTYIEKIQKLESIRKD